MFGRKKEYTIEDLKKVFPKDGRLDSSSHKGKKAIEIYQQLAMNQQTGPISGMWRPIDLQVRKINNLFFDNIITLPDMPGKIEEKREHVVSLSRVISDTLYFIDIVEFASQNNRVFKTYRMNDMIGADCTPATQQISYYATALFNHATFGKNGPINAIPEENGFYVNNMILSKLDAMYHSTSNQVVKSKVLDIKYDANEKIFRTYIDNEEFQTWNFENDEEEHYETLSDPVKWRKAIDERRAQLGKATVQEEARQIAAQHFPELMKNYDVDYEEKYQQFWNAYCEKMKPLNSQEMLEKAPAPNAKMRKKLTLDDVEKKKLFGKARVYEDDYRFNRTCIPYERIVEDNLYLRYILQYLEMFKKQNNRHFLILRSTKEGFHNFESKDRDAYGCALTNRYREHVYIREYNYKVLEHNAVEMSHGTSNIWSELNDDVTVAWTNSLIIDTRRKELNEVWFEYEGYMVNGFRTELPDDDIGQWKWFIDAYRKKYGLPSVKEQVAEIAKAHHNKNNYYVSKMAYNPEEKDSILR